MFVIAVAALLLRLFGDDGDLRAQLERTRAIEVASEQSGWAVVRVDAPDLIASVVSTSRARLGRWPLPPRGRVVNRLRFIDDRGGVVTISCIEQHMLYGFTHSGLVQVSFSDGTSGSRLVETEFYNSLYLLGSRATEVGSLRIGDETFVVRLESELEPRCQVLFEPRPPAAINSAMAVQIFGKNGVPLEATHPRLHRFARPAPETEPSRLVVTVDGLATSFALTGRRFLEAPRAPECSHCGTNERVVPILWGMLMIDETVKPEERPYYRGGCMVGSDCWHCRRCDRKF